MKLEHKVFDFSSFAKEMADQKEKKHFDYLDTLVRHHFGQ